MNKYFSDYGKGLLLGLYIGAAGHYLYTNLKFTIFAVPKYQVGDCLDNGLFYMKVLEIKKSSYITEAVYVTQNYHIIGKQLYSGNYDTTDISYIDYRYVKISNKYCGE